MDSSSKAKGAAYTCEYCKKQCSTKSNLNHHRKIHLHKTQFKCSFCEYVTNFKTHLVVHLRTHTNERPFICQVPNCHSAFMQRSHLNQHKLVHKTEESTSFFKFKCSQCPYKSTRKGDLKRHLTNHSEVKEYSCDHCLYRAKHKEDVKRHHNAVHLKLKPYQCQVENCESAFSKKGSLTTHQLVHKNDKDREGLFKFQCSKCPYKTVHKGSLNNHLNTHWTVKPFACLFCPFRSKHESSVRNHHKNKH